MKTFFTQETFFWHSNFIMTWSIKKPVVIWTLQFEDAIGSFGFLRRQNIGNSNW